MEKDQAAVSLPSRQDGQTGWAARIWSVFRAGSSPTHRLTCASVRSQVRSTGRSVSEIEKLDHNVLHRPKRCGRMKGPPVPKRASSEPVLRHGNAGFGPDTWDAPGSILRTLAIHCNDWRWLVRLLNLRIADIRYGVRSTYGVVLLLWTLLWSMHRSGKHQNAATSCA